MDHKTAERMMAVEKYLLDEFTAEQKDDFEEHFFACEECAQELKLGAAFMAHAKESLKTVPAVAQVRSPAKATKRDWFKWFSPAFALPAMAFMLGLVVFQNLVQLPELHRSLEAMNAPEVLPNADLKSGSARGEANVVSARPGKFFQLTIDIPDTANTAHIGGLARWRRQAVVVAGNPAGRLERWTRAEDARKPACRELCAGGQASRGARDERSEPLPVPITA